MSSSDTSLCTTINGIACDVTADPNAYAENLSNDGKSEGTIRYRCDWADRTTLAAYFLTANNADVGGTIVQVGVAHPTYASWFGMSAKISPTNGKFNQAFIDVAYKPLEFSPSSPTVVREARLGIASEVLPIASHSVKFSDGKKADVDSDFLLTYLTYKVTLKSVSSFPLGAVVSCLNHVHSGLMSLRIGGNFSTVPGDQVLYNGIDDLTVGYTTGGQQNFDVTHNFLIAPISLNKMYNPNSTAANILARFEIVTPTKYQSANLASLGV